MLKIAHLSDLHLGYKAGTKKNKITFRNQREQDGLDAFESVITQIQKEKPDIVIISGDLFHTPKPDIDLILETFRILNKLNIPIYILTGNHDTNDVKFDPSATLLLNRPEINIFALDSPITEIELNNINLVFVAHQNIESQIEVTKNINLNPNKKNILISHGSVFDENLNEILSSNLEPREIVLTSELLNKGWDLVLLGHIHNRYFVKKKPIIYYNGSLIRRGFADSISKLGRGWTLWTISDSEIKYDMFEVDQRNQYDIEFKVEKEMQQTELEKNLKEKLSNYDFKSEPIVRLTITNITSNQKRMFNFDFLNEYQNKSLTWNLSFKTIEEVKTLTEFKPELTQQLIPAFENFCKELNNYTETQKKEIYNYSKEKLENNLTENED